MSVKATTKSDEWVRCGHCGHKLFKLTDERYKDKKNEVLEIKCHSCKNLNRWCISKWCSTGPSRTLI